MTNAVYPPKFALRNRLALAGMFAALCISCAQAGSDTSKDLPPADAFKKIYARAERNEEIAQRLVGDMYREGYGVPRDMNKAVSWYRKAADQGDMQAEFNLAKAYEIGDGGLAKDRTQAVAWYRKAASQGSVQAMYNLGYLLSNRSFDEQKEARSWYLKAAEQNFSAAQYNYAILLHEGIGGPVDLPEARKWICKSADSGEKDGQALCAKMLFSGEGGTQDIARATAYQEMWRKQNTGKKIAP